MTHNITRALCAVFALGVLAWTAAAPPAAKALSNCDVPDVSVDAEEQAFLQLINAYRAERKLSPLAIEASLTRAAAWMANDLAGRGTFGHTDSLGRSPWKRMPDCGVVLPGGENLAAGTDYSSAQDALNAWISSGSHREVMLTGEFKTIGIARIYREGSTYGWYWVTDFGYGREESTTVATTTPAPVPTTAPPAAAAISAPAPVPTRRTLSLGEGLTLMTWDGGYVSLDSAFGPVANWVSMVYVFDRGTEEWLRWGPALDPAMRTLTELRAGVQYWVIATRGFEVALD